MVRARLSAADILHRGVVLSLVGVCIWGVGTGILVHRDTVIYSKPLHVALDTVGLTEVLLYEQKVEEANEQRWAQAAQAVLRGRGSKTA
ncbi:hypothetical protein BC826DRAFT_926525 [Russula brevipes]|nr:hypothetical protein BC826DRAFT_926525 [Russula brevipes]